MQLRHGKRLGPPDAIHRVWGPLVLVAALAAALTLAASAGAAFAEAATAGVPGGPESSPAAALPARSDRSDRPARSDRPEADDPSTRAVRPRLAEPVEARRLGRTGRDDNGLLRTLAALGVVVVLIFAARWLLRRTSSLRRLGLGRLAHRGEPIEVVARAPLGPRQQVALVRLGRRLVLVGSGPTGMSPLAEVTDAAEAAELLAEARGRPASQSEAQSEAQDSPVAGSTGEPAGERPADAAEPAGPKAVRELTEKLRRMTEEERGKP